MRTGLGTFAMTEKRVLPECEGWTQGEKRVMLGFVGERRSGWAARRFMAKMVPADWLAMWMCLILRWARRRGMVSTKTETRSSRGTGVEPPKPGLVCQSSH